MKISLHKAAGSSLHLPAAILFGMASYEGEEEAGKEEGTVDTVAQRARPLTSLRWRAI